MENCAPTAATAPKMVARTGHVYAVINLRAAPSDAPVLYARNVKVVMNRIVSEAHVFAVMVVRVEPPDAPVQYVTTAVGALSSVVKEVHVFVVINFRAAPPDVPARFALTVKNATKKTALKGCVHAVRLTIVTATYAMIADYATSLAVTTDGADAVRRLTVMDPYVIFATDASTQLARAQNVHVQDVLSVFVTPVDLYVPVPALNHAVPAAIVDAMVYYAPTATNVVNAANVIVVRIPVATVNFAPTATSAWNVVTVTVVMCVLVGPTVVRVVIVPAMTRATKTAIAAAPEKIVPTAEGATDKAVLKDRVAVVIPDL